MKRWLHRILLTCSIALMAFAVLVVGGLFADSSWPLRGVQFTNTPYGLIIVHPELPEDIRFEMSFSLNAFIPHFGKRRGAFPMSLNIPPHSIVYVPHWLPIAMGAIYPFVLWQRHRRRTRKDVGFPLSLSANENRAQPSQPGP